VQKKKTIFLNSAFTREKRVFECLSLSVRAVSSQIAKSKVQSMKRDHLYKKETRVASGSNLGDTQKETSVPIVRNSCLSANSLLN
jgi:hypothetical protein